MKLIDLSGPIYTGMWSYGDPFPEFKLVDIKEPEWVKEVSPKSQDRNVGNTYFTTSSHGGRILI